MLRTLFAVIVLATSHAANAACVIDRLRPTGTLPTMMMGQTFMFVATNDCANLRFTIARSSLTKVPTMGATAGPGAHWYSVVLSGIEWASVTDRTVTVFRWTVVGRDMTSGARIEVDGNNDLDIDRDGWTRSEGDVGRCDDFADRNPDATEICDNGIDENCNGEVDDCGFDLDEADAVVRGTVEQSRTGSTLGVADVNGDGIGDLLVGAPSFGINSGQAYVSFGPVSGTVLAGDDVTITPDPSGAPGIAESLAGGDADGDGFGDVLVGAWERPDGGTASLLLGPITGDVSASSAELELFRFSIDDRFGYHMQIAPDVDGSGGNDIVITAPWAAEWDGIVWVVPGDTTGSVNPASAASYTFRGVAGSDAFLGISAIALDDTDGDGIDDMAMSDRGTTFVVAGGIAAGDYAVNAVATATIASTAEWLNFDYDAAHLASLDYDGDGYGDLLVGDSDAVSGDDTGLASVLAGPLAGSLDAATDAAVSWRGDWVGSLVAAGDCNGDGEADAVLGTNGVYFGEESHIYLALGTDEGVVDVDTLPSFPSRIGVASPTGALLFAPDWSGDGIQEIVVGGTWAPGDVGTSAGAAYVYYSD
jgi:hypothetical protein